MEREEIALRILVRFRSDGKFIGFALSTGRLAAKCLAWLVEINLLLQGKKLQEDMSCIDEDDQRVKASENSDVMCINMRKVWRGCDRYPIDIN